MGDALIVMAGIAVLVATAINLHLAHKRAHAKDRREVQTMWWKLEMERDFERSKEQWR